MDKQSYIDEAEKELLHTYNRFSLVLDHGEGVHLYDTDGNAYLDFAAGIAVCALGYSNEHHKEALKAQVDKLLHTSNLYYNAPVIEAADKVLKASKMDRIFFTNSGTELLPVAEMLYKRYKDTYRTGEKVFPLKGTYKTLNMSLRHVARHAGLSFNPTMHCARHTFATTVTLAQGVPLETVSKMLGHKRITTTQIYAKITNDKIGQDMAALSEKLNGIFKVAQ